MAGVITKRCVTGSGLGLTDAEEQARLAADTLTRLLPSVDGGDVVIHIVSSPAAEELDLLEMPAEATTPQAVIAAAMPQAVIEAIPVDRQPVPIGEYYAFAPMPLPAAKPASELAERTAPPELWVGRYAQPQPPGEDVIAYIGDDDQQLHYLIGKGLEAPKRPMTAKWRRVLIGSLRIVSEIVGMIIVLAITAIVAAGVGLVLKAAAEWIVAQI